MDQPFCVTFAGMQGTSKSIVAHHLSERFGLALYSTDNIRFEVKEDMRVDNINIPKALEEFHRRRDARRLWLTEQRRSFIMDGSVDRTWGSFKKTLEEAGYRWFVIDMELSVDFLKDLFAQTNRPKAIEELPRYVKDHEAFMAEFASDVGLQITDETFLRRKELAEEALHAFLGDK